MERVQKEQGSRDAVNAGHVAQGESAQLPAQTDLASRIDNSPRMVAQAKQLRGMFGGAAQRQEAEEEPLQGKFATAQRVKEEEEPVQGKCETVQRVEEEEPLQGKFASASIAQLEQQSAAKPNNTGLPDNLKTGIESLSGISMDNVKVHYNSSQPAQLNALAYAQGSDIHVAPGQERHLPHEAWHVVQQAQGRVQPTMQMKDGVPVNDDKGLEHEADVMGEKAVSSEVQLKANVSGAIQPATLYSEVRQAKTLAQAGAAGALAESQDDKVIIGGNLGPTSGKAYVQDLGTKGTKEQALSGSAAAYAAIATTHPIPTLLSIDLVQDKLLGVQGDITNYLATPAPDTLVDAAILHVRDSIIKPCVTTHLKSDVSNSDLDTILSKLRKTFTKKKDNTFKSDLQSDKEIKNKFAKVVISGDWHAKNNVVPIDPFMFGAKSKVGGTSDLLLYYQHSPDWPGYVTYIEDGGESSKMRLGGKVTEPDKKGVPDTYSNFHEDTGSTNLSGMTALDTGHTHEQNQSSLDAMTKLAGEGARFVCVRSNISCMTDNSRFFVIVNDTTTKYVKLSDLWSSWAPAFDKANDISDGTVKKAILTGTKWTYDKAGGKSARVLDKKDPVMGTNDVNLT